MDLLAAQGALESLFEHHSWKHQFFSSQSSLWSNSHSYVTCHSFDLHGLLLAKCCLCFLILLSRFVVAYLPRSKLKEKVKVLATQLCLTLCDSMDCNLPGSSVHGILQARTLEWVVCPPPGDLPDPGIKPTSLTSLALAGRFFTIGTTWETQLSLWLPSNPCF